MPDFVYTLLQVIRKSYGRSHFHIRWGAEEEKHADLWRNAVLSLGRRNEGWMEDYTDQLRESTHALPWDDPLRMLFYTVFQERATQVSYLNLGLAANGRAATPSLADGADPVIASACRTIAIDEAAHYHFFTEAARLFLYYFPDDAITAMADVMRHFSMPAREIIPNYDRFGAVLHQSGIFSRRIHYDDVVCVALRQLAATDVRCLEEGIRRSRAVPDGNGAIVTTCLLDCIDHDHVELAVQRLFRRNGEYAMDTGVEHTMNCEFIPARPSLKRPDVPEALPGKLLSTESQQRSHT